MGEKPQVKLYLYPLFIDFDWIREHSPKMAAAIAQYTQPEIVQWDGRPETLPTDERVLVWISSLLPDETSVLDRCDQVRHFPFFYDHHFSGGRRELNADAALQEWLGECLPP